jgi:anthranilate synthase component I
MPAAFDTLTTVLHETLDIDTCPVAVYEALYAAARPAFLYESLQTDGERGRYSFLGGAPLAIATLHGDAATIKRDGERQPIDGPFADALRNLLADLPTLPDIAPLAGGLVGFFAYDYARRIERIPDNNPDTLGMPDALMMAPGELVVIDHIDKRTDILLVGPSATAARLAHIEASIREHADQPILPTPPNAAALDAPPRIGTQPTDAIRASMTQAEYEAAVETAKEHIRRGDIFQVVPSQRFSFDMPCDSLTLYKALRITNPSPYMYFLDTDDYQIVGSSPEMVVQCTDRRARIRPLAGTRKRGRTHEEDAQLEAELRADLKERAEHIMLVDLARNDLGRVCAYGSVQTSELLDIERYARVMHIVSNVEGMLRPDCDAVDLIHAVFPAGTVSGAPKIRAMQIIDELESSRRGLYGGAIGYIGANGNVDLCLAIRTIVVKGGVGHIQAGAGVVADSDPTAEYNETLSKAAGVLRALQLVEHAE